MADKPFPWMCGECGRTEVRHKAIDYKAEIKHDGKLYEVEVHNLEVPTCDHCGEQWFDAQTDDQINIALRNQIGLLQPKEIRNRRKAMGLTQKDLAEKIGVAVASLSRWENGSFIQAKSTDNLLRMFFKHPDDPLWTVGGETVTDKPAVEAAASPVEELEQQLVSRLSALLTSAAIDKLAYPWRFGDHQISLGDAISVFAFQRDDEDLKQLTLRVAALSDRGIKPRELKEQRLHRFEELRAKCVENYRQSVSATWSRTCWRSYAGWFQSSYPLEESLLGSLLLSPAEFSGVREFLRAGDFDNAMYRKIYEVMLECSNKLQVADANEWIRCIRDHLTHVEPAGIEYLSMLAERVTAGDRAREIALKVHNRSFVRQRAKSD